MSKLLIIFSFCLLCFTVKSQTGINEIINNFRNSKSKTVLIAAHRADWRNNPENSIAAIKSAIAMGVDIIEVDVKKTKDGQLVIMHDYTLDRTTNGKGKVSDFDLDSLRKLFLRNGYRLVTRHKIPTLEEVMMVAKGKVMVNLDHCYPYMREAYAILQKTGTVSQAIFKGDPISMDSIRKDYGKLMDSIVYMPVIEVNDSNTVKVIDKFQKDLHPPAFELVFDKDNYPIMKELGPICKRGARLWINTLWPSLCGGHDDDLAYDEGRTEDSWGWAIGKGFTIIQTDRPAALLAYLRQRGLHK